MLKFALDNMLFSFIFAKNPISSNYRQPAFEGTCYVYFEVTNLSAAGKNEGLEDNISLYTLAVYQNQITIEK